MVRKFVMSMYRMSVLMDGAKMVINRISARPHFLQFFFSKILLMNILVNFIIIIIIQTFVRRTLSASELNLRRRIH